MFTQLRALRRVKAHEGVADFDAWMFRLVSSVRPELGRRAFPAAQMKAFRRALRERKREKRQNQQVEWRAGKEHGVGVIEAAAFISDEQ